MSRKPLSKRVRFEVFKRDGFTCQYCGNHPPGVILHCDHIVAVANGGGDEMDNLVTSCLPCNLGKGARSLSVVPQSLAEKAAEIAEREEQLRGYQAILTAKRERLERETWEVMGLMYPASDSVPRDHFNSCRMFIEKLGYESVRDAAEIALASDAPMKRMFRYFCGVCWHRVREGGG